MKCPYCSSEKVIEKGSRGKAKRYKCKSCGKWSTNFTEPPIGEKEKKEFNRALKEKEQEIDLLRKQVDFFVNDQRKHVIDFSKIKELRFGVIGDLHIGSLFERTEMLKSYFSICEKEGINTIFCAGDVLDGHEVYKGQIFETYARGFKEQVEQFESKIPKSNIKVYFITGNHDSSFKKISGICVGEEIQRRNSNWIYCGEEFASIELKTQSKSIYKIDLLHPSGGSSYALSYKSQKIVESYTGGTKPNSLFIGHFHKSEFLPSYRNVNVIQVGTFQAQTPFMRTKGLAAHLGGWIVEVDFNKEKSINRFKAEFIAFYE